MEPMERMAPRGPAAVRLDAVVCQAFPLPASRIADWTGIPARGRAVAPGADQNRCGEQGKAVQMTWRTPPSGMRQVRVTTSM